ncbi:M23 family metallopeptidase [Sutcliffiella rhizosphaerae]|uniref:Stage IV sporulation protein FA n=1 Tax=Sutcliffiella rhizosphaerae TaxID=2880967 RepID=A0ABN8A923_9BACI|nr:M23 family metallopeptidase [Sutcliffiella rhizosphaerae]CAG9619493.1 Stage IV sporulation protein FA [Sutcliffiella rhizosphaerae]
MNDRLAEIRKRAAKRKRQRQQRLPARDRVSSDILRDEDRYGGSSFSSFEGGPEGNRDHPLFNGRNFLFKILASAILLLVVAIMFQKPAGGTWEKPRQFVLNTMEESFQFTAFSNWYEGKFGKSLALLPLPPNNKKPLADEELVIPASGKVFESFEANGQGVMVETVAYSKVEAMKSGRVTFVGKKPDIGKTVIVQHADATYSWYGQLENVDVKLYDFIETGDVIGQTTILEDGSKGMFYFAIQKDNEFIDPMQVISFE